MFMHTLCLSLLLSCMTAFETTHHLDIPQAETTALTETTSIPNLCALPIKVPVGFLFSAGVSLTSCTALDCNNPSVSGISCDEEKGFYGQAVPLACSNENAEVTLTGCQLVNTEYTTAKATSFDTTKETQDDTTSAAVHTTTAHPSVPQAIQFTDETTHSISSEYSDEEISLDAPLAYK